MVGRLAIPVGDQEVGGSGLGGGCGPGPGGVARVCAPEGLRPHPHLLACE